MDRTRRFPTGVLCRVIWRSAMGFHSKSIRFEGWRASTKVIGLKRTGKSCRLRWVNYLHPGLKRGKMTPQEELLVLELHSKWGNRWSRIARKLPGRTDNEIKNFWRTHMRKMAQEKKRVTLSPSNSSSNCSLASNNPTVDSLPSMEIGEESFYDTGGHGDDRNENREEEEEKEDKGFFYSMDDIWRDIDQSVIKPICDEFSCPPMASPPWEYGQYSLWKMAEEADNKIFLPSMNYIDQYCSKIKP